MVLSEGEEEHQIQLFTLMRELTRDRCSESFHIIQLDPLRVAPAWRPALTIQGEVIHITACLGEALFVERE